MSIRTSLLACATVLVLSATQPASAAPVSLPQSIAPGFGSTTWLAYNDVGAAEPFAGFCTDTPGFNLVDAQGPTNTGDAYDVAWLIFVDGVPFAAPGNAADLTGTTLTAGPLAMSGLQVSVQHYYSPSSAVARILVSLSNPGAVAITTTVQVPVNFGSDGSTVVQTSSSGDAVVSTADRWMVTSDTGPFDPVNTSVFYGPGTPQVTPASYTQSVFDCAGPQGLGATFALSVPAGGSRSLMFFAGLGGITVNDNSVASAQAAARLFDSNSTLPADWLSGLSATQQSQIVNWAFETFTTCAAEGFTGSKLTLCRQICEVDQSPTRLAGLIKLYMGAFRSEPPCAR